MAANGTEDNDLKDVKKELQDLALSDNTHSISIDNLKESVDKLEEKFDDLSKKVDINKDEIIKGVKEEFVKYVEFEPIKTLVYGLVGGVLVTVLLAVMVLVIAPSVQQKEQNSPVSSLEGATFGQPKGR